MTQTKEDKLTKRREYDRKRLADPEVRARMKAYRQSERGKEMLRRNLLKYRQTDKYKEYRRKYKNSEKYKLQRRDSLLRKNFGVTLEQYNQMLNSQNGVCAICNQHTEKEVRMLAVDHCHKTGKVRGLLCRFCNQALGQFNDDTQRLSNAINYLNKYV